MKVTIEKNELDEHFLFDMFVGVAFTVSAILCFITSIFWDIIARQFVIQHASGLGIGQILIISISGFLSFVGVTYIQNTIMYMKYYGR